MKKSENMPVWLRKMVLAQQNCTDAMPGKRHSSKRCAPAEKGVINMI
jgi:hypothetical protein